MNEAFLRVWLGSDWARNAKKAQAHSGGEAGYYAAASAISETMLIREMLLFMGLKVRTGQHSSTWHVPTSKCWNQLVKRGVVMVGEWTSAKNHADMETKSRPVHRLRQLRHLDGLVLDLSENAVNGEKEDGPNKGEQWRAAMQTVSDPGQRDGRVVEALGSPMKAIRGTK